MTIQKLLLLGCMGFCSVTQADMEKQGRVYGVLQGSLERAEVGRQAGWNVALVSVSWDVFEPAPDQVNQGYVKSLREKCRRLRSLGYRLQLDLGMQYPPGWIFHFPGARYRNQFGAEFDSKEPGKKIPNYVFNQAVRGQLASYMGKVFESLGTDWDWVRLGGGFYGEVNFPQHEFAGKRNCYWAFDEVAQGKLKGLPEGMEPCPVPGWIPGTASADQQSARLFLEWYLGSLQHYHDWQIRTVRRWYSGDLCMMYGSWGIRPGWIEKALEKNLDGSSPAEKSGEISTGYDWSRMIGGIQDAKVIVHCTWIDAPEKDCDDDGKKTERWSPVHWQASLAQAHPLKLRVWGENTGRGDRAAMLLAFERMKRFGLMGLMWAFEEDLFADPNPGNYATSADYAAFIMKY